MREVVICLVPLSVYGTFLESAWPLIVNPLYMSISCSVGNSMGTCAVVRCTSLKTVPMVQDTCDLVTTTFVQMKLPLQFPPDFLSVW